MVHIQTIGQILEEQRTFDYQKVIADAIKNRRKISFYYNGPTRPRKDSVKPGRRILVEPTTLGLTDKGNLAFKGYVKPPSVTKTGFEKHNWRTFLLNRLHRLELTDDTFDQPQPGYNSGDDSSFSRIDAKVDFNKKSRINKYDQPVYAKLGRKPIDRTKEPEPQPVEPEMEPGKPEPMPVEPEVEKQPEGEPMPVEPEVEKEPEEPVAPGPEALPQPKVKPKPPVNPPGNNGNNHLQEEIKRIKTLMFKIKVL